MHEPVGNTGGPVMEACSKTESGKSCLDREVGFGRCAAAPSKKAQRHQKTVPQGRSSPSVKSKQVNAGFLKELILYDTAQHVALCPNK